MGSLTFTQRLIPTSRRVACDKVTTVNEQDFTNVGDYLRTFLRALNEESAQEGDNAFTLEARDEGLSRAEIQMLR